MYDLSRDSSVFDRGTATTIPIGHPSREELKAWVEQLDEASNCAVIVSTKLTTFKLIDQVDDSSTSLAARKWSLNVTDQFGQDPAQTPISWDPSDHRELTLLCLDMLRKLCQRENILPQSFNLPPGSVIIAQENRRPEATGGSADVWRGLYKGRAVALKVIRDCEAATPQSPGVR